MSDATRYCGSCGDTYWLCECDNPVAVTFEELCANANLDDIDDEPAPAPVVRPVEPFVFTPVPAMPPVTAEDLLRMAANDEAGLPDGAFVELSRALRGDK